jgi:CDP-diglyceride synthetase
MLPAGVASILLIMFLVTHFAVPVIAVAIYESIAGRKPANPFLKLSSLLTFGLVGLIPDAFYPHLGGGSHYHSFSHSIWAMGFFLVMITLIYQFLSPHRNLKFRLFLWLSLLSHYVLDFFSGGIKWLYPFNDAVIGIPLIPTGAWVLIDFFLLGVTIFMVYRIRRSPVIRVA